MRKRPCLLFACIFLTGIVFQRYRWKILCFAVVCFLIMEVYHGICDGCLGEHGMQRGQKIERNSDFKKLLYSYRYLGRIAGRSFLLLSAFFLGMSHMKSEEAFRNTYMSNLEDGSSAVVWGEIERIEKTEYGNRLLLTDCYVATVQPSTNHLLIGAKRTHNVSQSDTHFAKGDFLYGCRP